MTQLRFAAATLFSTAALLVALPAHAAAFNKALDVYQGFNFRTDKHTSIGCVTTLTLGGAPLAADLQFTDPTSPATKRSVIPCVAVMSSVSWEGSVSGALQVAGQVSTANQQKVNLSVMSGITSSSVTLQMVVYEYDPMAKVYFKSLSSAAPLNGNLEKAGTDVNLAVASDPSTEVASPRNFSLQFGVVPAGAQQITLAASNVAKVVKAWGLK
jgi:hypothetical protein